MKEHLQQHHPWHTLTTGADRKQHCLMTIYCLARLKKPLKTSKHAKYNRLAEQESNQLKS